MRIFDPKDQLGNAILSSADTQKSSVKLEKQMTEGSTITLTSTDISDIENWELSNARVEVDGQMVSFLPETSRDGDGNLVIAFGRAFSNVVLILKRTVFDGMKHEEVAIEVKIQLLMAETMAAATAPTPRTATEVQANVAQWKVLGTEAVKKEQDNYPYAACSTPEQLTTAGLEPSNATTIGSDICLISFDTVNNDYSGTRTFPIVQTFEADLPSLKNGNNMFKGQGKLKTFTGKIPNVTDAYGMFDGCTGLTSWTVALPNSLTDARYMFQGCTKLTSWSVALPNSITTAQGMFSGCTKLTSWNGTLPDSITDTSSMFQGCTGLKSWTVALPNSIKDTSSMFQGCTGLTSWSIALPDSITTVSGMFAGCSGLKSFTASLAALERCSSFVSMFEGCKLNETSIRNILGTLPEQQSSRLPLTIGCDGTISKSVQDELESLAKSVSISKRYMITLQWN